MNRKVTLSTLRFTVISEFYRQSLKTDEVETISVDVGGKRVKNEVECV